MTKNKSVEEAYKHKPKYMVSVLKEFTELFTWLKQISRLDKIEDFVYITDYKKEKSIRLKVFTKKYQYSISARLPRTVNEYVTQTDKNGKVVGESNAPIDKGYLGCMAQTRKPRAGEDWNRGNDLSDGSYSEETWNDIKNDIVAYELVKAVRNSLDKNIPIN